MDLQLLIKAIKFKFTVLYNHRLAYLFRYMFFFTVTCSTTTTAQTGQFKTIRNPGQQVEQCLSITVPTGFVIEISCTSVYSGTGTYALVS